MVEGRNVVRRIWGRSGYLKTKQNLVITKEKQMQYLVQCHIHMHEDRELFAKILELQNNSRKEKGCKSYFVCQEPTNTTHYLVIQRWENKNQFETHLTSSHYKKFIEYVKTVTNIPITYEYFDTN
ncbi:antibiotic biosynthesis monooxygenase domain containing protein [Entamoeba histolytica HM-3:IMSS]|nr:antibiotic biosynthesis monooxygenase domain containing protein [Entamoeba histolytica HM-3:IMSS]GAT97750.1 hypothetical protein conserved domain containing [Entamoeba histolytica]GAT98994.1 hypothetical protein conserved domain containing [Entamoeba histolytica]